MKRLEATGRYGVGTLKNGADGRRWRFRAIKSCRWVRPQPETELECKGDPYSLVFRIYDVLVFSLLGSKKNYWLTSLSLFIDSFIAFKKILW